MSKGKAPTNEQQVLAVKDVIKLDAFKGKMLAKDIIDNLSSKASETFDTSSKEFDPQPLIRIYDLSVDELLKLRKKVQNKIDDLEDAAQVTDNSRKAKFREFSKEFEEVQSAFETLEVGLGEVGNTAIRIGEQLEIIDKQISRATEAKSIIHSFMQFNVGQWGHLDDLRSSGYEGKYKVAIMLRRLLIVAKEIELHGTETAKMNIEKYSEDFEKSILEEFDAAYKNHNIEFMNQCAKILCDFNGGNSCVQMYINQHDFFIKDLKLYHPHESSPSRSETARGSSEKARGSQATDLGLIRLYAEILNVVKKEWEILSAVFPNAHSVLQQFLQRIFAQSIQSYLETQLSNAEAESFLLYLRKLAFSHSATSSLVNDLHRFDEETIFAQSETLALGSGIDRAFNDLFVPYTEGDRYIDVEHRSLFDRFDEALAPFFIGLSNRLKPKKDGKPMVSILKASGLNLLGDSQEDEGEKTPEELGLPSVELTIKLIEFHYESTRRCHELASAKELPNMSASLFRFFIEATGTRYVEASLNSIIEEVTMVDAKVEPDLHYIPLVKICFQILHLVQLHFQTCVLPTILISPVVHRECVLVKNEFIEMTETLVNSLIQKQIEASINWIVSLLGRQKKADFKPRDESYGANNTVTQVCGQCCDFVEKIHKIIVQSLDPENAKTVLLELGNSFHSLLLEHYKRYPVSQAGSLILAKDLSRYHEMFSSWGIDKLEERFDMLRELGNLFIVKPESLKTVINEGYLSQIATNLLLPYVSMRTDYGKFSKYERDLFQAPAIASTNSLNSLESTVY